MALPDTWISFIFATCACFVIFGATAIQRLYFHKLRGFPGPKLAASTSLYKVYYEVLKGGELLQHLIELHAKFGPVVRIAPNELHFNSHLAYSDIYSASSRFKKDRQFYKCFGADGSAFGAIDHLDSRTRRSMLSPLFSRRAILKLEGVIQEKVDKLLRQLAGYHPKKPVNMFLAFRCTTMDIISAYCFANCVDSLDAEDFYDPLLVTIQNTVPYFWIMKLLPFLIPLISSLPEWCAVRLHTQFLAFLSLRKMIAIQIDKILNDGGILENTDNPTVYHHLLSTSTRKGLRSKPSRRDLLEEALSLLQAGSDTVGNTCTIGTFYVLNNPAVHTKLSAELREIWPDMNSPIGYTILEKLPYLTAIIKESLRVSHGIVTPLPRIVGPSDTNIAGFCIPVGTVVGVSVTCLHNDPVVFPEPQSFSPERWIHSYSRQLDNHLAPFSRGPRMCLGINLAWCELYLIFGNIFRRLDMDIHDTTVDDFSRFKEYFIPIHQGRQFHAFIKGKPV